jgi:cell division protein FtsL
MTAAAQRLPRRGGYFVPIVLVVGMLIAANYVVPFREILAQNRQVETAQADLAAVQAENAGLVRETEALQTSNEIERIAREDYGYVRPGDTSYVIVEPVGRAAVAVEPIETEPVVESGGVLKGIWHYLTGRDLTADG